MSSYSIKPWGRAAIVGNTVAGLCLGIGMRWRETVTELIEKHPSPDYELKLMRRLVLSQNSLQILQDLGMTAGALDREGWIKPAGLWRFVTDDGLDVIREGSSYPGCAPAEATFQIAEGALIRTLRREYIRFGGVIHWGSRAGGPFMMSDGSGFWALQKEYGAINEIECIIGTSKNHKEGAYHLFGQESWDGRPMIKFPVTTGWCWFEDFPDPGRSRCFPSSNDVDFVIVLGKGCALHMWKTTQLAAGEKTKNKAIISWRLVSRPDGDWSEEQQQQNDNRDEFEQKIRSLNMKKSSLKNSDIMAALHPNIRHMFAKSHNVLHDMQAIPTASCALLEEAASSRVTIAGDCLLPVDAFEFRGDQGLVAIEDSSALVRRLFKEKYYRGFVPVDFREHEMDCIARRTKLVQRDLQDVEVFLNAADQIAENKANQPIGHIVGTDQQKAESKSEEKKEG
jgi:hypothetical protein